MALRNRLSFVVSQLPLVSAALLGLACSREYAVPLTDFPDAQLLVSATAAPNAPRTRWRVIARQTSYNGTVTDLPPPPLCARDNERVLAADSLYWFPGLTRCIAETQDTVTGTWRYDEVTRQLHLTNDPELERPAYRVQELLSNRMVLHWSETSVNGYILTETVTLSGR